MPGTPAQPLPETPAKAACAALTDLQILQELVRRGVMRASLANLIVTGEITCEGDIDERKITPEIGDLEEYGPLFEATAELRGGRKAEAIIMLERILPREWIGTLSHD